MKKRKLAGALIPALFLGSPAFASTRSVSRFKVKKAVVNSTKSTTIVDTKKQYDPFNAFDNNINESVVTKEKSDILEFLAANDLLSASSKLDSLTSGANTSRKNFAASCLSGATCYDIPIDIAIKSDCTLKGGTYFAADNCVAGNNAPTDIALTSSSINDSDTGSGADVGTLSTTDSDGGDSHTYTLVTDGSSVNGDCGDATSDDNNGDFQINGSILETGGSLTGGTYKICLQTDDGTTTFQEGFTITVNNTTAPEIDLKESGTTTTSEAFGTIENNNVATSVKTFTLHNLGNADLTTTSVALVTGTHFTITGGTCNTGGETISSSGSCTIEVTMKTTSIGALSDTLRISSNDSDEGTYDIALSGTGQDTTAPTITNISIPNTAMKVGDTVTATITVSSDSDDYTGGSGAISGTIGGFSLGSLSKTNDTTYTATFTVTEGGTDVASGSSIPVSFTLTDSSGNTSNAYTTAISQGSDSIDANTPSGYSVAYTTDPVTSSNETTVAFQFSGAEVGATYNYSIDDTNGGTGAVSGSGTISNATDTISNVNVSSLDDDTLTLTVSLTDPSGNQGSNTTDTVNKDTTAPSKSSSSPSDGATDIAVNSNLSITFSENVALGSGNIILYKTGGVVVESFNAATGNGDAGGTISVATNTLTINPNSDLIYNQGYYLQIANTAIEDSVGNTYAGISDTTSWNFTTIAPSVTLSASDATVAENGGTSTLTATLSGISGSAVTVNLAKSGTAVETTDYTLSSTSIIIAAGQTTGTATVTAVNDALNEGDKTVIIDIDSVSGGTESVAQQETITITDDEVPGFTLSKTTASVDESATTDTFTVVLNTQPIGGNDVSINLVSDDTGEATVSPANLTIANADWNIPQTVTITGVDDITVDGNIDSTITLTSSSGDAAYDALSKTVTVTTTDDDIPGYSISKTTASVNESGTTDSFTIVLDTQPSSDVVITVISSDTGEATVNKASVTFTNGNWDTPQTVTITGIDDADIDGNIQSTITMSINDGSSDDSFDPLADQTLIVTTTDDENVAPVMSDISKSTPKNTNLNITLSMFTNAFSDTDVGDSLDKIRFTSLGTKGVIQLSGTPITVNQEITSADIDNLVYVPNSQVTGSDSFTYEASDSKSYSNGASLNITISAVNEQPVIAVSYDTINLTEDDSLSSYEFSVADPESEDITVSVQSSNTEIVSVISNWVNPLTSLTYNNNLRFDLRPVANGNGTAIVTIKATDASSASSSKSFTVNIESVNDSFNLEGVSKQIYYKNFSEKQIPLLTSNVDTNEILTYSVSLSNPDIINYTIEDNTLIITSSNEGLSGTTTVTINATDGEYNDTTSFEVQVLLLEKGDDIEEEGTITVTEEDGVTIITITFEDGLIIRTEEKDGEKVTTISAGDTTSKAISTLSDAQVEILENILYLIFEDLSLGVKAQADVHTTGEVVHTFTYNDGKINRASSEASGATTQIDRINGLLQVVTSLVFGDANIEVEANEDGSATHTVTFGGQRSRATSNIRGARTVINSNGAVTTTAGEMDNGDEYYIKVQVVTKANGETVTRFVKVNKATDEVVEVIGNTMKETTPYPLGNEVEIEMIDNVLYIKTKTPLTGDMIVE